MRDTQLIALMLACVGLIVEYGQETLRRVERMTPPDDGEWHFYDGPIYAIHAASPDKAIKHITSPYQPIRKIRQQLPRFRSQFGRAGARGESNER